MSQPTGWPGQPPQHYAQQPAQPYQQANPYSPSPVMGGNLSKISVFAWLAMGGGLLAFVFSFLPVFNVRLTCNDATGLGVCSWLPAGALKANINAWGSGALVVAWGAALLMLLAALVVAIVSFSGQRPASLSLAGLGLAGVGFVLIVVVLFINPSTSSLTLQGSSGLSGLLQQLQSLGITIGMAWSRAIGYWLMFGFGAATVIGAGGALLATRKQAQPPLAYPGAFAPQQPPADAAPPA